MYKIIKNINLCENIYLMEVYAPNVSLNASPGQFVIIMTHEKGERIPLTICDYDKEKKTVTLIYQVVGVTTELLSNNLDNLYSITGPLGNKSLFIDRMDKIKTKKILFVGGGVGIAPIYPQIKYLAGHNIKCDCIYGIKNKNFMILKDELESMLNKLYITSDDGSYGDKGFVTDKLEKIIDDYDEVITVGPLIMMKEVVKICKNHQKEVTVSMNPIMVDGTGMCGSCRLNVNGKTLFACTDGPEFNGLDIDFDLAIKRLNMYKTEEGRRYLELIEGKRNHDKGDL